jgi:glucose/arabinose dehydrogenase
MIARNLVASCRRTLTSAAHDRTHSLEDRLVHSAPARPIRAWRGTRAGVAAGTAVLALVLSGCSGGSGDPAGAGTAPATCGGGNPNASGSVVAIQRVFPGLTFTQPVALLQAPRDAARWYVVEQAGRIRVFEDVAGVAATLPFLDITDRVRAGGELGLLGLAFHPRWPAVPRAFVIYTAGTAPLLARLAEFRSLDGGATLDRASEQVLLSVEKPNTNHNGGHVAFGPDGLLYAGFGDGGGAGDPHGTIGNGQSLTTLLGKLLRIDVDATSGALRYAIPSTNPFAANAACSTGAGAAACPEIYAWGFRNPWRWSFDRGSGELWLGDVGQSAWEEIDRVERGGNYGWRCREGAHPFNAACGGATSLLDPVAEYPRAAGQSVTGGYVYRGSAVPALAGCYVFGDFVNGRIWSIARTTTPTLQVGAGLESGLQIASFAEGSDGELYVVGYGGTLHRIVRAP